MRRFAGHFVAASVAAAAMTGASPRGGREIRKVCRDRKCSKPVMIGAAR